ncbi:unnamed protein product [Trichobilharzia regenti]|nr:unnamed protein product [Trichobilharzia regenti]
MVETDRLNKMTAVVQEETGLSCVICHEGQRIAPNEPLGIYVYVRRCTLEENLCMTGCDSPSGNNPPQNIPDGYSTLSNFVIVHFSCHTKSFRASSENEWVVAQRHNWDVGCNNILPILNPPISISTTSSTDSTSVDNKTASKSTQQQSPDTVYSGHLANFMEFIMVYLHTLLMSSQVDQELEALKQFTEVSGTYWIKSDKCWITTGPLYRIVAALHLWSCDEWLKNRVILLQSLLYMAVGRLSNPTSSNEVSVTSDSSSTDSRFTMIKPYLVYFGLIDSIYEYLFKVSALVITYTMHCFVSSSLSHYIRTSDEALMIAAPKLLAYFEENLLTIASIEEFLDVMGLLGSVTTEELENIINNASINQ